MNTEIEQLLQLEKARGTNLVEQSLGYKLESNPYGLSETEFLVTRMLVSNGQSLIQNHLYTRSEPTELESLLCEYLDSALEKLPKEDTTETVFRVTSESIFKQEDIGTEKSVPAYLTASKKWLSTSDNCVYVIRLNGRTKARSIYKAYEVTPFLPEEQVEFPRNTKFYVADVCRKEDRTMVELWERPDNLWPAEKLTNNVSDFFSFITTIDIKDAVKKGLNPVIHIMSTVNGKDINAMCTPQGQVYVSPTFAQALWNLCYVGLWLADDRIVREELLKGGMTLEQVCEEIDKAKCQDVRALYFKALLSAYNWEDLLYMYLNLLHNAYTSTDDVKHGGINVEGELEKRVNGMCMTGMGCILLHELTHFYGNHTLRMANTDRRELEQEADDMAFDALLNLSGNMYKTGVLGGIAPFLLGFYRNPPLIPSPNYYREDIRLFRQYDKITKEKKRVGIFVANVLSDWLERYHNIKVEVKREREDETVEEIRKIINGL